MTNTTMGAAPGGTVAFTPILIIWPYGVVALSCFLVGVPANLISLVYFVSKNKRKSTYVSMLYMFMNCVDLLICIINLPLGISCLAGGRALLFQYSVFCSTFGYLSQVVNRLSVFCIGVLSILRTISLICPFVILSKSMILGPISVYAGLLLVQQSLPWWYGVRYSFTPAAGCGWNIEDIFPVLSIQYKVLYVVLIVLEYILPLFPIVVSCVISIFQLRASSVDLTACCDDTSSSAAPRSKLLSESEHLRRTATVTIIILTMVYIFFNLPYCFIMVLDCIYIVSDFKYGIMFTIFPAEYIMMIYIWLVVYTIPLNSTINPIVYVIRIKKLREYVIEVLCCRRRGSVPVYVNSMMDQSRGHDFRMSRYHPADTATGGYTLNITPTPSPTPSSNNNISTNVSISTTKL